MPEILMLSCLALMGIYFFKSTDLPKDLKKRSLQVRVEPEVRRPTMSFPQTNKINLQKVAAVEEKIRSLVERERQEMIEKQNKEIDELTIKITTLEGELKVNNSRNEEIQKMINIHLERLVFLEKNRIS